MKKIILILGLLVLLVGCSPRTPEGSCMNSCENSHDCTVLFDEEDKPEEVREAFRECQISCWKSCYGHIISTNTT